MPESKRQVLTYVVKPTEEARPRSGWAGRVVRYVVIAAVAAALYFVWQYLEEIKSQWYIFTPEELHTIAQRAVKAHPENAPAIVESIVTDLSEKYPSWAINRNHGTNPASLKTYEPNVNEWVFNNAGGAMGTMFIIHASITEYLIIFGTPLGTEGHTGRHTADDYFMLLVGEQWAAGEGALTKERYAAGDSHHLPRGVVKQYKFHDGGFALEYARGWIPPMLPFGFADSIFSTFDLISLYKTVYLTGREMIRNLINGKI